jgi:hypothetical protein
MNQKRRKPMKGGKKLSRSERQKRKEIRAKQESEELVELTAQTFTCAHEIAIDFAFQCRDQIIDLDGEIIFNEIALEIWNQQHSPSTTSLVKVMKDLLTERDRYRKKLSELETQFNQIIELNLHEHLEPIDPYIELVRARLELLLSR